jgi:hypothetical protein
LAVERIGHDAVSRHEPAQRGVVDAGVGVDQALGIDLFLAGEAARGERGQRAGGIVRAIEVAPLAPGIIGIALKLTVCVDPLT